MLSVRCLAVLSVCDVGVLWPNGWTDQDETWHAGRPWPWPHCVRWGHGDSPSPPLKGHSAPPQLSAHICCGQMAAWIKMPLGMELCLGPGDCVLDGDSAAILKKGAEPPSPNFLPMFIVSKRLEWMDQDGTCRGGRPQPRRLCIRWGPSPPPKKGAQPPQPIFGPISIVTKRLDASRCHFVWR